MPIVRIKPFDPRKGHRLRQMIDSANDGKRYVEGNLYNVAAEEAEHLSWFMQDTSRVDPKVVVHGQARAFDVFLSESAAKAVLEEEARGQLLQPSTKVFDAPGRDAPEAATPSNLATTRGVAEERPPTALERRNAKMAEAAAKKKSKG